jgi:hypothetical protein
MKVYIYPADMTGCGWFRLIWPAEELIRQGHDVTIMWPNDRGHFQAEITNDVVKRVHYPADADVIVVQRVSHRHLANALAWIREQGVAVVMDIDDDLSSIHPRNPAWQMMHPKSRGGEFADDHSWNHTITAAKHCTLTTVTSPALAQIYRGINGARVLHNYVPDHYLDIEHTDSPVMGWGGAVATHPDDLQEASTGITRLMDEGHSFVVVGPVEGVQEALGTSHEVACTGPLHIDTWPYGINAIGVGIAPLADTRFNKSKSALKPIEYAALGIPSVVSPRAEYRSLSERHGIGVMAARPKDWYKALKKFVTDDAYRQDTGASHRETARTLAYSLNAYRWAEVWEEAVKLQRG